MRVLRAIMAVVIVAIVMAGAAKAMPLVRPRKWRPIDAAEYVALSEAFERESFADGRLQ